MVCGLGVVCNLGLFGVVGTQSLPVTSKPGRHITLPDANDARRLFFLMTTIKPLCPVQMSTTQKHSPPSQAQSKETNGLQVQLTNAGTTLATHTPKDGGGSSGKKMLWTAAYTLPQGPRELNSDPENPPQHLHGRAIYISHKTTTGRAAGTKRQGGHSN